MAQVEGVVPRTSGTMTRIRPRCSGSLLSTTDPRYLPNQPFIRAPLSLNVLTESLSGDHESLSVSTAIDNVRDPPHEVGAIERCPRALDRHGLARPEWF